MLCTCITNFDTFRRHLRPNNNVKCPNSRFYTGRPQNGVTGDCLQNLEHLHGNIIRFVLKPNVREIVYQKSHNKCKLTSIVVLCRSFA